MRPLPRIPPARPTMAGSRWSPARKNNRKLGSKYCQPSQDEKELLDLIDRAHQEHDRKTPSLDQPK